MQNSKFIQNLVSILICISLVFSNVLNAGALTISANKMVSVYSSEYFELDGQTYLLETVVLNDKIVATVYNKDMDIISHAVNADMRLQIDGKLVNKNSFQTLATPNYKLVSTDTGTLKVASWGTVAIIAAIASKIPGASAAAIAALASAIVADAGSSYTYKLETWTATDGTFFYQKSVLKIYNKETGEKVGSSIVKETKTHIK